jgi:hypothetical protein
MDMALLFSILRERDVKLWVEEDALRCSAPLGALDEDLRTTLTSQKANITCRSYAVPEPLATGYRLLTIPHAGSASTP